MHKYFGHSVPNNAVYHECHYLYTNNHSKSLYNNQANPQNTLIKDIFQIIWMLLSYTKKLREKKSMCSARAMRAFCLKFKAKLVVLGNVSNTWKANTQERNVTDDHIN